MLLNLLWFIIIYFPMAMKFIIDPIPLIGKLTIFIIQFSPSIHLIVFPLSIIMTPILIIKLPSSSSYSIQFEPLILRTGLILLFDILKILRRRFGWSIVWWSFLVLLLAWFLLYGSWSVLGHLYPFYSMIGGTLLMISVYINLWLSIRLLKLMRVII